MRTKYALIAGLITSALAVLGAGCVTPTTTTTTNTADTNANTTVTVDDEDADIEDEDADEIEGDEAEVSIVDPLDGDIVEPSFDLAVEVEDFTLSSDIEGENVEGEGHYHIWVDGEYVAQSAEDTVTLEDLEEGDRELVISLQNNDHTDLEPAVESDPITVTVETAVDEEEEDTDEEDAEESE